MLEALGDNGRTSVRLRLERLLTVLLVAAIGAFESSCYTATRSDITLAVVEAPAQLDEFATGLWIGSAVTQYGDWNRDGSADFVVSVPRMGDRGVVAIVCGASGRILKKVSGPVGFGAIVELLDADVDADASPNIVIDGVVYSSSTWRPLWTPTPKPGRICGVVEVHPPQDPDGQSLLLVARTRFTDFGYAFAIDEYGSESGKWQREWYAGEGELLAMAAIPAGGIGESMGIVVASRNRSSPGSVVLEVRDAQSGQVSSSRVFATAFDRPRVSLCAIIGRGDATRSLLAVGVCPDVGSTVGATDSAQLPTGSGKVAGPGAVLVLGSEDLATHYDLSNEFGGWDSVRSGYALAAGDFTGDGMPELLATSFPDEFDRSAPEGLCVMWSPTLGVIRRQSSRDFRFDNFGARVANLGDLDGDGASEYCIVGGYFSDATALTNDGLTVYSGKTGSAVFSIPPQP